MTETLSIPNPFDSDVVARPDQQRIIDVPEINSRAFDACRESLDTVYRSRESRSVLLHGPAGSGKTHVLARFRRWLLLGEAKLLYQLPPVLVNVRMETAPSRVWRYLQRRVAEQLLEPESSGASALEQILTGFAHQQGAGSLAQAFENRPVEHLTLDAQRVLEHYLTGRHRKLCRSWLKGESMHAADLDELRVSQMVIDNLDDDVGEATARDFLLGLHAIAAPRVLIYCFDQLEALLLGAGSGGYNSFGNLAASLVDETHNALLISSILITYLPELQKLPTSLYQRLTKSTADLLLLTPDQGLRIVTARLDDQPELAPYRPHGGVTPLSEAELRGAFPAVGWAARKLIHHAREQFEQWRGASPEPPVPTDQFLALRLEKLRAASDAWNSPAQSHAILEDGLAKLAFVHPFSCRPSARPGVQFEAGGAGDEALLLALLHEASPNGLAHRLKRIASQVPVAERARLRLIRDPRLPISTTAKVTRHLLQEFEAQGARMVHPSAEAVAALDAVQLLLSRSKSEDLNHAGESVAFETVRQWLAANLPPALDDLADQLRDGSAAVPEALLELLGREKILTVDDAAARLGSESAQVLNDARSCPDQVALLAGPPAVLFRLVAEETGGDHGGT